ncbi:unnamed protein product [Cunninghamella blakesleeana]
MSKYATLPDIDDQPDVYETADVTEETQYQNNNDEDFDNYDNNENVIQTRISVKDASNRFKDSIVDSTDIDFSDRLTRRKKAMYRTYVRRPPTLETDEYEILPKDMVLQETRLQKLRRLIFEVQELSSEVEKDENENKETNDNQVSQTELLSQITYLQNELSRLQNKNENNEEDVPIGTTYGKRVDEAKSLIKQLESYKALSVSETSDDKPDQENKNENGNMVTYELFYTPETAKAQQQNNVTNVDERIAKLEKLIGTSYGQGLDSIPSNLTPTSLVNTVSKLEQQISLLAQPRHLDVISRKIKVLNSELERLHELKSGGRKDHGYGLSSLSSTAGGTSLHSSSNSALIGGGNVNPNGNKDDQGILSNDTEEKVNHLFATMEKVDPLLNLTPTLLTRLKALQGLHTEAATFGKSVKLISEEQTRMTEEIKSLDTTCDLLSKSLKENEESINKNISVIDTRMTELVKRIEALNTTGAS